MKKFALLLAGVSAMLTAHAQAPKKVLLENYTGTWCGYCPRGKSTTEEIVNLYPNVVGISMHNGDFLSNTYSNEVDLAMNIISYPRGTIDRATYTDSTYTDYATISWKNKCIQRLATTTPVDVNFNSTYNSTTRQVDINVIVDFVGNASGDLRISCLLVEDSIVKTTSPQKNYMGNGCTSPDQNSPWYSYPCWIANYVHNDIPRINLANDNFGTAGVIPNSVNAGQQFTQSYSHTLPASWNDKNMRIVAFVSRYGPNINNKEVLNIVNGPLGNTSTGISENKNIAQFELKQNAPNPFTTFTAIQFRMNSTDNVELSVYDVLGNKIKTIYNNNLSTGDHTFYWSGENEEGSFVAPGVYYYRLVSSNAQVAKPMMYLGAN